MGGADHNSRGCRQLIMPLRASIPMLKTIRNIKEVAWSLFWIFMGIVFLAYSGRAEGFVSMRSVPLIVAPVLVGLIFLFFIKKARGFFRRDMTIDRAEVIHLCIKLIAVSLFICGVVLDSHRVKRTMRTGDDLVKAVEQYKMKEGHYPVSLEGPEFKDYKPSLLNTIFQLHTEDSSQFFIRFHGVAFTICERANTQPNWVCED